MDLLGIKPHKVSSKITDKIFLYYGQGGTRKTSVAVGGYNNKVKDRTVLGAFEIGYKFIDGVKAEPLQKWSEMKRFVRELGKESVKEAYDTVVIDTVTLAYGACYDYILDQFGVEDPGDIGYGKGWRYIRKEFEKTILSIPQMGYGLTLIAHSDEFEDEDKNTNAKVDIDKRPAAIIKGLADFILYLKKEHRDGTEELSQNETVYAYSRLIDIETKTRSRYFPARFEFTYENLENALEKAVEEQKRNEGIETTEEAENLHKIKKEDFEELKTSTLELAQELIESGVEEPVKEKLVEILQGVPLSQTTTFHRGKLVALRESFYEMKATLNE